MYQLTPCQVPMYEDFIQERFERCLDLYLCPRSRKKRINIDPESLVPKLPKPMDLQPFPMTMCLEYIGHSAKASRSHACPWLCVVACHHHRIFCVMLFALAFVSEKLDLFSAMFFNAFKVTSVSVEASGQWLASGSADGVVKLWEVICASCWNFCGSEFSCICATF